MTRLRFPIRRGRRNPNDEIRNHNRSALFGIRAPSLIRHPPAAPVTLAKAGHSSLSIGIAPSYLRPSLFSVATEATCAKLLFPSGAMD
jgi:hypothetical protein